MAPRPKDRPSLEIVSRVDGGWYDGDVFFDGSQLRVHFTSFGEEFDEYWDWTFWKNAKNVLALVRLQSKQLQDHQCEKVSVGATVCANYRSDDGEESKYFDARVLAVHRSKHSRSRGGKKEICDCQFRIAWEEGPLKDREAVLGCAGISFINRGKVERHPDVQRVLRAAAVSAQGAGKAITQQAEEMKLSTNTDEWARIVDLSDDTTHDSFHMSGRVPTAFSSDLGRKLQTFDAFQGFLVRETNALHTVQHLYDTAHRT